MSTLGLPILIAFVKIHSLDPDLNELKGNSRGTVLLVLRLEVVIELILPLSSLSKLGKDVENCGALVINDDDCNTAVLDN